MKATFYLPAHPSYFDDEFTQSEIDRAIALYDQKFDGVITRGNPDVRFPKVFTLLRTPGKAVTVLFDSTGFGESAPQPEAIKQESIDQYRITSHRELATHVHNIKEFLKLIRSQANS